MRSICRQVAEPCMAVIIQAETFVMNTTEILCSYKYVVGPVKHGGFNHHLDHPRHIPTPLWLLLLS